MTGNGIDWEAARRRIAAAEEALAGLETAQSLEALFRQRARRLARTRTEPETGAAETGAIRSVLGFHLGGERYALSLSDLAEVAPLRRFAPVPGWPRTLVGVVNRRGTMVPLLNLHALLQLPDPAGEGGYVLFLRGRKAVGVRVEALDRVYPLPAAAGQGGPAVEHGPLVETVTGDGLILLDTGKVLERDELGGVSLAAPPKPS